jgi:hypothetical protein
MDDTGQRATEGNTTTCRGEEALSAMIPTILGTSFHSSVQISALYKDFDITQIDEQNLNDE